MNPGGDGGSFHGLQPVSSAAARNTPRIASVRLRIEICWISIEVIGIGFFTSQGWGWRRAVRSSTRRIIIDSEITVVASIFAESACDSDRSGLDLVD